MLRHFTERTDNGKKERRWRMVVYIDILSCCLKSNRKKRYPEKYAHSQNYVCTCTKRKRMSQKSQTHTLYK